MLTRVGTAMSHSLAKDPSAMIAGMRAAQAKYGRNDWRYWGALFRTLDEQLGYVNELGELAFPTLARCYANTRRSAKDAKDRGLTPWQWRQEIANKALLEAAEASRKAAREEEAAEDRRRALDASYAAKAGIKLGAAR